MPRWGAVTLAVTVCLLELGCQSRKGEGPLVSSDGQEVSDTVDPARGLLRQRRVNSFAGRWGLVVPEPVPDRQGKLHYHEICLALLEFQPDKQHGGWQGQVLTTVNKERLQWTLTELEIEDHIIRFKLEGSAPHSFEGGLQETMVRGNILAQENPEEGVKPAMLLPTDEERIDDWEPMILAPGNERFLEGIEDKQQPQGILQAAEELRGNPLSLVAYQGFLGRLPYFEAIDQAEMTRIAKAYLEAAALWGPRMSWQSRVNLIAGLVGSRRFPDLALEWLDSLPELKEMHTTTWQRTLMNLRQQALVDQALQRLKNTDVETKAQAFEMLRQRLELQRYNAEILVALAEYAESSGQLESAEQYLADVVALPMLERMWQQSQRGHPPGEPTPREKLLKLYEQRRGSREGFEEFLAAVYHRRMEELMQRVQQEGPPLVPTDEQQRTVLVEVFTGTMCPPCVAADVASVVLASTYPQDRVAMLQFHQHIPGPDPLTNQDAEERFAYYEGQGTPTVIIDGVFSLAAGGVLQHVGAVYGGMRQAVDQRLRQAPQATLIADARRQQQILSIRVRVEQVPTNMGTLRLRMAIVEPAVSFSAANGIREHHGVVREMIGGARGLPIRELPFEYQYELPLSELRKHLEEYLERFEAGREITFPEKPLQLQNLQLVAWIQRDDDHEVLQTVVLPFVEVSAEDQAPASAVEPANQPASSE
ncbi:MAG: hypothetical protein KatS3mg113_0181 [Planctomycetaceae bacterium]|nr:MAG: hypothetical protein KatS3mg113_0181 [Planctomycetaceae bacterium]